MKYLVIFLFSILLIGCNNEEKRQKTYDSGYSDGYAEGYNTTCNIRATMVYGHWDSEQYSRGYNDGRNAGSQQCIVDKRNNNVR